MSRKKRRPPERRPRDGSRGGSGAARAHRAPGKRDEPAAAAARRRAPASQGGAGALAPTTSSWWPPFRRPAPLPLALTAVIAFGTVYLGLGYSSALPVVTAPVAAGLLAAVLVEDWRLAAATSGASALAAALLASVQFAPDAYVAALKAMPSYANPDVLQQLLYGDVVARIVQAGPFFRDGAGPGAVAAATLVAVCAGGLPGLTGVLRRPAVRSALGWLVTCLAVLTLVVTAWHATPAFRQIIVTTPADGEYAYDADIYLRTYYEMAIGDGYYRALVRAAAGDKRLIDEGAVKDGRFVGWASSPALVREPGAFYLWRLVAPAGATGILIASLVACAAVLALWYWALARRAGPAAAFVPWALFPVLLLATSWHNIFFPDWWMALALLASVALWVRGHFYPALAAALLAALFREVAAFWLVALLAYAAVRFVRERRTATGRSALTALGVAAACFAAFAVLYWLHLRAAATVIAPDLPSPETFVGRLRRSAAAPLVSRFVTPTEYMLFPYGRFVLPGVVFLLASPVAWWFALRRGTSPSPPLSAAVLPGYLAFLIAFTATVGATSSYWGQGYMPLAIAGIAAVVAVLAGGRTAAGAEPSPV